MPAVWRCFVLSTAAMVVVASESKWCEPVVQPAKPKVCQSGWVMYDAICYNFTECSEPPLLGCSGQFAMSRCESVGGSLARVRSADHESFLISSLPNEYFWLGGSDVASEGVWLWPDGTPLSAGYTNWFGGSQPTNDDTKNCMYYRLQAATWDHWDCNLDSRGYVCEKGPQYNVP